VPGPTSDTVLFGAEEYNQANIHPTLNTLWLVLGHSIQKHYIK
jgi:hypothetical protein